MVFNNLVKIGRVVYIAKGNDEGKIATIVNIIDSNRVLIDGPTTDVKRTVRNLKDLQVTKYDLKIRVGQRTKGVQQAFTEGKISEKFQASSWAKKNIARAKRASLNDFERFKLMKAKQHRNRLIRIEVAKLKKASK